ncbi:MAG: alpha/beta hydrolase [Proteobacteria bacterium]|nr:alpha/beta hydrolase [Pseudomonadota bacterium]
MMLALLIALPCAAQEKLQEFMLDKLLRGQGEAQQQKQQPGAQPPDRPPAKPIAQPAETATIAGLSVAVWMPPPATKRPMPLIVFSHGFRGCNTQSSFLMRALADKGYLVLAPNHHDAACRRRGGKARAPELHFDRPGAWNEHSYEDRRNDLAALLDAVQKEVPWSSLVDKAKIGLAGHSLGGYTVIGLAGGWESWQRKDVKAVLALSPYVEPFIRHGALDRVAAAVMYQGGTADLAITPSVRRPGGAYDKTPAPVTFVELRQASHLAWTDLIPRVHDTVVHYALAFFDNAFKGAAITPLHERYGDASDVRWKK